MYFLYSLLLAALLLVFSPYFIYQAIRHGKYIDGFKQRFGSLPAELAGKEAAIWVHAVSVGEFNAAKPLIAALRREIPDKRIIVSTTTLTGQRLARASMSGLFDATFFFPLDFRFVIRRVLSRLKPAVVVILETELWPNFLDECARRRIKTILVNGRISNSSFSGYRRIRSFIKRVLNNFNLILMQSDGDANRIIELGASSERIRVTGNLKYDLSLNSGPATRDWLGTLPNLIIAGSTADGEEEVLLGALKLLHNEHGLNQARLAIAPRRPQRFEEVARSIEQAGFSIYRFTSALESGPGESDTVILIDTIGELASLYQFASVVFVGGSLIPRGGHNVIEPAMYAPVVVGPHTDNFRQIVTDFKRNSAIIQLNSDASNSRGLAEQLARLMKDSQLGSSMTARARELISQNRGATDRTVSEIIGLLRASLR